MLCRHVPAVPHTVINSNTPDLPSDSSPVTSNGMCILIYNLLIVIYHCYQLKLHQCKPIDNSKIVVRTLNVSANKCVKLN